MSCSSASFVSQRALNTRNNMTIMQWLTCLVSPLLVTNEPMLSTRKLSTPRVQKHRAEKQRRREKRLAQARRRNEKRRDAKRCARICVSAELGSAMAPISEFSNIAGNWFQRADWQVSRVLIDIPRQNLTGFWIRTLQRRHRGLKCQC